MVSGALLDHRVPRGDLPVGLYLMWRSHWPLVVKIIVTIVIAVLVYLVFNMTLAVQAASS